MSSTTAYVIQSGQNPDFCVGVTSATAGTLVTLKLLSGVGDELSQWNMDPDSGYITLASNPELCLDVQGYNGNQGQVVIDNIVLGRGSQKWNWVGSPPNISNLLYPTMVIDNSGGNVVPGNAVLVWPLNGGQNQKWSLQPIPAQSLLQQKATQQVAARV